MSDDGELLTFEEIKAIKDIRTEIIEIPEWPGKDSKPGRVKLRGASSIEMDDYQNSLVGTSTKADGVTTQTTVNLQNQKARLVARCMLKKDDTNLFAKPDEGALMLGQKCSGAINRLFNKVHELSGNTPRAKSNIEKNLDGETSSSSAMSSPASSKSGPATK